MMDPQRDYITGAHFQRLVAAQTGMTLKVVRTVLGGAKAVVVKEMPRRKKITVPGLVVIKRVQKPAKASGSKLCFGKEMVVAAKPAKSVVKAVAVKAVKDAVLHPL